jgi:hydroxycarboxylate dehydrogenase B
MSTAGGLDDATVKLEAQVLQDLVAAIFAAIGCSTKEAGRIATYLVGANLAGHDSHGVVRVPRYVQMHRDGLILADQVVERIVDTPVMAILDGKYGFGQTVAPQAVEIGIAKCRANGLSAVGLRYAGHIGRVGDWAEMAAQANLVSMHFVNAAGSVLVAPFGGIERRFSTAPYCMGVPRPGQDPLILDFATSVVAEGKVLVASQGGKRLPADALVGPDGAVSGDPRLLYGEDEGQPDHRKGRGAIRAFGDHKGSGLAFMCELIGGALTGTGATDPARPRFANGMFSIYVDPTVVDPRGLFPPEVARYVTFVKSSRPIEQDNGVMVPGEPEAHRRAERQAQGIPLPEPTWLSILATARAVGLEARPLESIVRK